MSKLFQLCTHVDNRGSLTVIEKILPFDIKRVYFIYGVDNSSRGQHRHIKTIQAAVCIQGFCSIFCQASGIDKPIEYILDDANKCLLIEPKDFHWMCNFSNNCILLVLASEEYDKDDYIFENYI